MWGRWNIIDVAAFGTVVLMVVVGYGAFRLFRTPTPVVASIAPAQILSQETGTLHVTGEHFRPFLSVRLGSFTAPLLVASPTSAQVNVKDLPPGTYDLVLLDEARELLRMPSAITVVPAAPPALTQTEMQAVGAFVFLSEADAARITTDIALDEESTPETAATPGWSPRVGQVLAVLPPEISTQRLRVSDAAIVTTPVPGKLQVPAIVRFRCTVVVDRCRISGLDAVTYALVRLAIVPPPEQKFTRPVTHLVFRIDELRPATAALKFEPGVRPVSMEMNAVGDFINLSREDAQRIKQGSRFGPVASQSRTGMDEDLPVADVLTALPPESGTLQVRIGAAASAVVTSPVPNTWQVPAIIRLRCVVAGDQCRIGDASMSQGAIIGLAAPTPAGPRLTRPGSNVLFRIERLGPVETQMAFPSDAVPSDAVVRMKFFAKPEVAGLPMAGDEDFGVPVPGGADDARRALRAVIVSVDTEPQTTVATTQVDRSRFQETMATFEVTLHVPVILTSTGWQYAGRPVKVGAPFRFEGRTYAMDGWVLDMQVGGETRSPAR